MKFTLVFEGELSSNGSAAKKQVIREKFHPQLADLWTNHPSVKSLRGRRFVSINSGGYMYFEDHHSIPIVEATIEGIGGGLGGSKSPEDYIDLCQPIEKSGMAFLPLVRERVALRCNLKIIFLRHEPPGRIYQGGDIDNRLKTLLDAPSVPQHTEQVVQGTSPMYCLLEDDSLIAGLDVQTQRLLAKPNATVNDVHLLIEVDVRVTDMRGYNQMFLGD